MKIGRGVVAAVAVPVAAGGVGAAVATPHMKGPKLKHCLVSQLQFAGGKVVDRAENGIGYVPGTEQRIEIGCRTINRKGEVTGTYKSGEYLTHTGHLKSKTHADDLVDNQSVCHVVCRAKGHHKDKWQSTQLALNCDATGSSSGGWTGSLPVHGYPDACLPSSPKQEAQLCTKVMRIPIPGPRTQKEPWPAWGKETDMDIGCGCKPHAPHGSKDKFRLMCGTNPYGRVPLNDKYWHFQMTWKDGKKLKKPTWFCVEKGVTGWHDFCNSEKKFHKRLPIFECSKPGKTET